MEEVTKGRKGFYYLKEIIKNPDVHGVIVLDESGNSVFEEVIFSISPVEKKEIADFLKGFNDDKKTIIYVFTRDKLVMFSKNPSKFKGFLITIARKSVNLGFLRVYHQRFIEL
ncbi:MAG: hypothetical protein ABDH49_05760 [Candidatus Hydrothermales bacterium]